MSAGGWRFASERRQVISARHVAACAVLTVGCAAVAPERGAPELEQWQPRYGVVQNSWAGMLGTELAPRSEAGRRLRDGIRAWTLSMAEPVPEVNGYRWPTFAGQGNYFPGGHGSLPVGVFLARLYEATGDKEALEHVRGLGEWLCSVAKPAGEGYYWEEPIGSGELMCDLNHGVAGVTDLLRYLSHVTGEKKFLDYALGGARALLSVAVRTPDGYKWPDGRHPVAELRQGTGDWRFRTGRCTGTAGIAEVFYHLYYDTGETWLLEAAGEAMRWLESQAIWENDSCKWPRETGSELFGSSSGKGVSGIGYTFLVAHLVHQGKDAFTWEGVTKDQLGLKPAAGAAATSSPYLRYAAGAARWLATEAIIEENTCVWKTVDNITGERLASPRYCFGNGSIGQFLLPLELVTDTPVGRREAGMSATWLALQVPTGVVDSPEEELAGTGYIAANGMLLARYSKIFDRPDLADWAELAARSLLEISAPDGGGLKIPRDYPAGRYRELVARLPAPGGSPGNGSR